MGSGGGRLGNMQWVTAALFAIGITLAAPPTHRVGVIGSRPHDRGAYTQGLLLYQGRLFESTGQYGGSSLREVDPKSGRVLRKIDLPREFFAEGLARVPNIHGKAGDHLIQLTWRERVALVYDLETFARVGTFVYPGEGWGLCFDGQRLVMSDGTDRLTFRHARTFEMLGEVRVTSGGRPRDRLNELECVDGAVYANVWSTDQIVRINPDNGRVTAIVDASSLLTQEEAKGVDVLNGIAHLGGDRFLLTGKWWPKTFEVEILARGPRRRP